MADGSDVRCLVRARPSPADFLRDWGVTVVNADLTDKSSIPAALVGIHTIIDCATARPEESTKEIDWEGKVALIQSAQAMGIQRYMFCSIHDCDKYPNVPLMNIKHKTEQFLDESGLDFTVLRMCGLAFADLLSNDTISSAPMEETYELLGMNPSETTKLKEYLTEYYGRILKKLKEVGAESKQTNFYI